MTSPEQALGPFVTRVNADNLPTRQDPFSEDSGPKLCPYCAREVITFLDAERKPYDRCIACGCNWRAA